MAIGASDPRTAARAAAELVFATGAQGEGLATAQRWARHSRRQLEGIDAPEIRATLLHNLGLGQLVHEEPEALDTLNRALEMRRVLLGEGHTDTVSSRKARAQALGQEGDYEQAEAELGRALASRTARLGPQHPSAAALLVDIGVVQQKRGQYKLALETLERALAIYRDAGCSSHPTVLIGRSVRASVLAHLGKVDEAEAEYRDVLEVRSETLGSTHQSVSITMTELGRLAYGRGQTDEARQLFERALELSPKDSTAAARAWVARESRRLRSLFCKLPRPRTSGSAMPNERSSWQPEPWKHRCSSSS